MTSAEHTAEQAQVRAWLDFGNVEITPDLEKRNPRIALSLLGGRQARLAGMQAAYAAVIEMLRRREADPLRDPPVVQVERAAGMAAAEWETLETRRKRVFSDLLEFERRRHAAADELTKLHEAQAAQLKTVTRDIEVQLALCELLSRVCHQVADRADNGDAVHELREARAKLAALVSRQRDLTNRPLTPLRPAGAAAETPAAPEPVPPLPLSQPGSAS